MRSRKSVPASSTKARQKKPALSLSISAAAGKTYVPYVRKHLRAAHALLHPPLVELSLALVGDAKMSKLHEQFLGIPGPTDVLTFPLDTDDRDRPISGEVILCVPEAKRRARDHKHPVERELLLYALHGLLHLCGHDDRTDAGYRRMHRAEDMILTELGVGPVFNPKRGSDPASQSGKTLKTSPRHRRSSAVSDGARR